MGREVGVSIYRWGFKTSCLSQTRSKTGWTAPGRPDGLSASLTGRLLHRLVKLTKTGWTSFENRLNLFGRPVSLSASLIGRLHSSLAKLTKPVEPPLTTLSTCSPVWLADCWSEVRGVRDQLNCPEKPVQLVLTREFKRENPSSTGVWSERFTVEVGVQLELRKLNCS